MTVTPFFQGVVPPPSRAEATHTPHARPERSGFAGGPQGRCDKTRSEFMFAWANPLLAADTPPLGVAVTACPRRLMQSVLTTELPPSNSSFAPAQERTQPNSLTLAWCSEYPKRAPRPWRQQIPPDGEGQDDSLERRWPGAFAAPQGLGGLFCCHRGNGSRRQGSGRRAAVSGS